MAQLTDDCFAFSGPLLRLDEMECLIAERIAPVAETERVPLHGARNRVVAADVMAPVDLPPFDNSAVDGYAVRHADLRPGGDTTLVISGRLTAGTRSNIALEVRQGHSNIHRRGNARGRRYCFHAGRCDGRRRSCGRAKRIEARRQSSSCG